MLEQCHQPRPARVGECVAVELAHVVGMLERVVGPEHSGSDDVAEQDVDAVVLARHEDASERDVGENLIEEP